MRVSQQLCLHGILLNMLSLFAQNPAIFALLFLALILSLSFHEFAHAYVADKLGDPTARYLGRLTINPLAHLDIAGTVMLLLAGFGWGKPVPFNPANLTNPKRDSALVALAGPASNFLLAYIASILLKIGGLSSGAYLFLYFLVFYNLMLGFFNLMPVHPLDGFKIVGGFLPLNLSLQWHQLESSGFLILMILFVTRVISMVITPLVAFGMAVLGVSHI